MCPLVHHPGLTRIKYKFTSRCLFRTPTVGAPGRGLCAFQTRPRMANHNISWVLGAHVHFGNLDFIITVGGELVRAHTAIRSLPPMALTMRGLVASSAPPLDHDSPGRTSIASPSPTMTAWRNLLGRDTSLWNATCGAPRQCFRSVSATPRQPLATLWRYAWFNHPRTLSSWGN